MGIKFSELFLRHPDSQHRRSLRCLCTLHQTCIRSDEVERIAYFVKSKFSFFYELGK